MSTLNLRKKLYYSLKEKKRQFLNSVFDLPIGKGLYDKLYHFDDYPEQWLLYWWKSFSLLSFFRITDLGNIKRRLYLSTVHKELSSTPLHAKIPLFMIKRKIVSVTWMLLKILNLNSANTNYGPTLCIRYFVKYIKMNKMHTLPFPPMKELKIH